MQIFQKMAEQFDADDILKNCRKQFLFPKTSDGQNKVYLCGHSLGLQPVSTREYVNKELQHWADYGVEGHFSGPNPWLHYHETVTAGLATLTGSVSDEVVAMNSLTTNLHLLLVSFYRPTPKRYKILLEQGAFPSDRYAIHSQVQLHGYSIEDAVIEIPVDGDGLLAYSIIEKVIAEHADELALILLPGMQYKTGQVLPIRKITEFSHQYGCTIGWDLAHAIGNIPLQLHDWQCDFAVWCHYKYLNAGPGAIGGCFVHQRHLNKPELKRLAGWWGHSKHTRFNMPQLFEPLNTVEAWQLSNPPILQLAALRASLDIFAAVDFKFIRAKSLQLTRFLRDMLAAQTDNRIQMVTPIDPDAHGSQLSLRLDTHAEVVVKSLAEKNIIADFRAPDIIRVAPVALYNSFNDVYQFVQALKELS